MITRFIDFKILFISLVVGIFFVYISQPASTIIYVYPTPENVDKIQYKDTIGNCYEFKHKEVNCPTNKNDIHTIPIQES
tara:strand:- start:416 stop:652 length:237 start_codon:yes stop_codon:yes gene_type:complete